MPVPPTQLVFLSFLDVLPRNNQTREEKSDCGSAKSSVGNGVWSALYNTHHIPKTSSQNWVCGQNQQIGKIPGGIASVPRKPRVYLVQEITKLGRFVYLSRNFERRLPPARTRARRPPFPGSPSGEQGPQASQELTSLAFKYKATH